MRLTDEATYEMVHSNLNALEISDETGVSMIGNNAVLQTSSQIKQSSPNIVNNSSTFQQKSLKTTLGQ